MADICRLAQGISVDHAYTVFGGRLCFHHLDVDDVVQMVECRSPLLEHHLLHKLVEHALYDIYRSVLSCSCGFDAIRI